ncbi:hypothetical protein HAX54_014571 [Datura stramonium]|uniref:Uncharacterized protein n=1 Tax=Datura stramonium TaxID=4076 RepID=A0ABS8TQF8_DATST|nr:hypothetical protein [Datura stramonium]
MGYPPGHPRFNEQRWLEIRSCDYNRYADDHRNKQRRTGPSVHNAIAEGRDSSNLEENIKFAVPPSLEDEPQVISQGVLVFEETPPTASTQMIVPTQVNPDTSSFESPQCTEKMAQPISTTIDIGRQDPYLVQEISEPIQRRSTRGKHPPS